MAIFIQSGDTANKSEYEFFKQLKDKLPLDWVIIGNAELVESHKTSEVDAVIIGGGNIFVIELKCWNGTISGDTHTWNWGSQPGNIQSTKSPVNIIRSKAKTIASFSRKCNIKTFIVGYVVLLAEPPNKLNISSPDVQTSVFFKKNIVQFLLSQSKNTKIGQNELLALIKKIGGASAGDVFLRGGEKPKKPDTGKKSEDSGVERKKPEEYVIKFSQKDNNFKRVYYSSEYSKILLGKAELRGSEPNIWQSWKYDGIYLHLQNTGFCIECIPGSECIINNTKVPIGPMVKLDKNEGEISICGIKLDYKFEEYKEGL